MKNLVFALILSLTFPFAAFAEQTTQQTVAESLNIQVNINTDSAEKLADVLVGIGPAIAARIVAYRTDNGPFSSIDDLLNVKGFGAKKMEANRNLLTL